MSIKSFKSILFSLSIFMILSCNNDSDSKPIIHTIPEVYKKAKYDVDFQSNVLYGKGQVGESFSSDTKQEKELKLDIYTPKNNIVGRPVIIYAHGGSFIMGNKYSKRINDIGKYYASRGWVFVSVGYRLMGDYGDAPDEWYEYANNVSILQQGIFKSIYPAIRDVKAATRFIIANADTYNINKDYLTLMGASAGAIINNTVAYSEAEDYTNELIDSDPTLKDTYLGQDFKAKTVIDLWGSFVGLDALELIFNKKRVDSEDPPILIIHGTNDVIVPYSEAMKIDSLCQEYSIDHRLIPLEGRGHSPFSVEINNQSILEVIFDYVTEKQYITIK